MNKSGESELPCLIPYIRDKIFSFSCIQYMSHLLILPLCLLIYAFLHLWNQFHLIIKKLPVSCSVGLHLLFRVLTRKSFGNCINGRKQATCCRTINGENLNCLKPNKLEPQQVKIHGLIVQQGRKFIPKDAARTEKEKKRKRVRKSK